MDNQTKALLLGVSLRWRKCEDGVSQIRDYDRERRLNGALERLTINHWTLEPDVLSGMLYNPDGMLEWLDGHPNVLATIGHGHIALRSSEFSDIDFEKHTCPFEISWGVEDFAKSEMKEFNHWIAEWMLG